MSDEVDTWFTDDELQRDLIAITVKLNGRLAIGTRPGADRVKVLEHVRRHIEIDTDCVLWYCRVPACNRG